jgi:hypothetical protein
MKIKLKKEDFKGGTGYSLTMTFRLPFGAAFGFQICFARRSRP